MEKHKHPSRRENFFSSSQICNIAGISRRQLQYWDKTGLVNPTYRTEGGHGRYTFQDLIAIKAAKRLIDAGVSVQGIRKSIGELKRILPKIKKPLEDLTLVATGDVILVFYENTAFEAVSGQEWIMDIADVYRDIERWQKKRSVIEKYRGLKAVRGLVAAKGQRL
ncbi:MAG: MerR family transcriptional regulator [Nitrospirae bacterium]|nr:MerR family transcriptional regulator [Nitrospirota bacterium]